MSECYRFCDPHKRMERKNKVGEEEDEIVEQRRQRDTAAMSAPTPTKRTKTADADDGTSSGAGMCDDVVGNILARVPARTAVACTALSKHHRRLIRSPEFRSLHCRLAPQLPRPHVAYLVTAPIKRSPDDGDAVARFHGFHVAGAGISGAPLRTLTGSKYLDMAYINTCNGVVLLGMKEFSASCKCTLWNPAVAIADGLKEVTVPASEKTKCLVLGLGYGGRSSKTYKLLLCHKDLSLDHSRYYAKGNCHNHHNCHVNHSLLLYDLGDTEKELRLQTIISAEPFLEISRTSLYIAGSRTLYLLHFDMSVILAFDMDDETVSTINLPPGSDAPEARYWFAAPVLMEVSGHLCVVTNESGHRKALWFLTLDHKWEQKYLIGKARDDIGNRQGDFYHALLLGVWDCGGVLVLYLQSGSGIDKLCLYHVETKKMFMANLPCDLAPNSLGYEWCWGYRPTLVSPGCIVGKFNEDRERQRDRSSDIALALKPINEQDKKKGCKMTLDIVCFMELLVRIMQKLPDDLQDVLEMTLMDSEDPIFFSVDALYSSG